MSRKVLDSSFGDADFDTIFDNIVSQNPQLNDQIEEVRRESNVFLCEVLRIYSFEDKAYVKILNSGKSIFCRLSHEVLGGGMVVDYLPNGVEMEDKTQYVGKKYIQPFDELYGIVMKVRWENLKDEYVFLGYVNIHDSYNLRSSNLDGEISIKSGSSNVSVTNERVNIITPSLFINGLPFDEPELKNYYDKKESDLILDSITSSNYNHDELLYAVEDYKRKSNTPYFLFRNDLWTVNFNFEAIASITSDGDDDLTITGVFRTTHDMVGLYWHSKDLITHPYISYGERCDYTDVILEFDYEMSNCIDFSDWIISITIASNNGEIYYVPMPQFIDNNGHFRLDFNQLKQAIGQSYRDVNGDIHQREEEFKIPIHDIKYLLFVLVPNSYRESENPSYEIMENVEFECRIFNIRVTNGFIDYEHKILEPHQYKLCEGYDDFYNLNPLRVAKEMRKLGYTEWVDLYIGASHFYEKKGIIGDIIDENVGFDHSRTEKMVVDTSKPLNVAFKTWLDHYANALKENDCENLIISISMENLQAPESWRQKHSQEIIEQHQNDSHPIKYAETGWVPSTFFYSPTNDEVINYVQNVSRECLDIVVDNGLPPILQLGEAWWWWQEGYPEAVKEDIIEWELFPGQPPAFYDDATLMKFEKEFGRPLTVYTDSSVSDYDETEMEWIKEQLEIYSDKLREVVKEYNGGIYMALFFPPFVTDVDRVPAMMRQVNYLKNAFHPDKLDILQLEDYDWVTTDDPHHYEVYNIGEDLGFPPEKTDYFGGYVQYHRDAPESWKLIKNAMNDAIDKGFREVYAWSGSQIRRDGKILGYDLYEFIQNIIGDDEDNYKHQIIESTNVSLDNYDVDFNINFGISGRDDMITVETFLKQI